MKLCEDVVTFPIAPVHCQLELDLDLLEVSEVVVELGAGQLAEPATAQLEHECSLLGEDGRASGVAPLTLRLRAGGQETAEV